MSITAIAGSSSQLAGIQGQYQQIRSQFKQLGQDLQGGRLTKAQTDFVTLSQSVASRFSGTNPVSANAQPDRSGLAIGEFIGGTAGVQSD